VITDGVIPSLHIDSADASVLNRGAKPERDDGAKLFAAKVNGALD
jgi:hypothetical protein